MSVECQSYEPDTVCGRKALLSLDINIGDPATTPRYAIPRHGCQLEAEGEGEERSFSNNGMESTNREFFDRERFLGFVIMRNEMVED